MYQRHLPVIVGHSLGEPCHQPVHIGIRGHAGCLILLRPAVRLAGEVIARLAKIGQPCPGDIDLVQSG